MPKRPSRDATPYLPVKPTLPKLRDAVNHCEGCDLYQHATQGVLGEGPAGARVLFIGEQPGSEEDLKGRPFVGPSGKLLDRTLEEAGIDRTQVYVTNAVKHFKFEERGKRRIHKKPSASEVNACRPWLETEVNLIRPRVIVCLGATATQAVLGRAHRLTQERGHFVEHDWAASVTATVHPSAILRAPDDDQRHQQYAAFVADLKLVAKRLKSK
jgi:DNA polymerase